MLGIEMVFLKRKFFNRFSRKIFEKVKNALKLCLQEKAFDR